uniref:Uncharacterized protein n=1 Tax=Panagrolaimus sp. PS1159 TaxID=55785 RepID=A0AC35EXQ5_9BILA
MAEKLFVAAADKKPIIYEISPKWILIYLTSNVVIGFFAVLLTKNKINCYKFKGKDIPAKHQEKYDTLKITFDAQCKIRFLCWLKNFICDAQIAVDEVEGNNVKAKNANINAGEKSSEVVDTESVTSSDSESESSFSTDEDDSSDDDSDFTDSFSDKKSKSTIFVETVKENNIAKRKTETQYTPANNIYNIDIKSFDDVDVKIATSVIKNEIIKSQVEANISIEKINDNKNSEAENDLKQLECQLAEVKAEILKLKNSVEKLVASQTVF